MTQRVVEITGNTYPVKDAIKALGGHWNAARKAWMVPAAQADAARALVGGATEAWSTGERIPCRAPLSRPARYGRGTWTGCSCGSREANGELIDSPRNCASCEHDA